MKYLLYDETVTRRLEIPDSLELKHAEEYLDCVYNPHQVAEVLHREIENVVEIQNSRGEPIEQNPKALKAPKQDAVFDIGDWVMYKGKPRPVSGFFPFGKGFPDIMPDSRYDMIEVLGIKALIYTRDVQRMTVEEKINR